MTADEFNRMIQAELSELSDRGLRRTLRTIDSPQEAYVTINGRRLCCLCSNNYLGLANHPRVRAAAVRAIDEWGWG
ncbi:MAG: 8-amino-7-oxononanoate synthase, partial [Phycisphaerae bacterium]